MSDSRSPLQQLVENLRQGELHVVLGRYSEILLAMLVITTIAIMIIPIPTFLMDVLLSANMAMSIAVLMICLYVPDALSLAAFPTILLLACLFRLALEVAATRLILLHADAGDVIHAFGTFVVKRQHRGGPRHLPDHHPDAVHRDRQRRGAGVRGVRPLHPRRHARQADVDRRRPARRPRRRGRGPTPAAAAREGSAVPRGDGRSHEVRQGRRHRRDRHHRGSTSRPGS